MTLNAYLFSLLLRQCTHHGEFAWNAGRVSLYVPVTCFKLVQVFILPEHTRALSCLLLYQDYVSAFLYANHNIYKLKYFRVRFRFSL
jgi:hypothetical protein